MGGKLCINVGLPLFEKKIEYVQSVKDNMITNTLVTVIIVAIPSADKVIK